MVLNHIETNTNKINGTFILNRRISNVVLKNFTYFCVKLQQQK